MGQTEPDPKKDITLKIDGRDVAVPQVPRAPQPLDFLCALAYPRVRGRQGKVIQRKEFESSSFSQSEYLLYQESQVSPLNPRERAVLAVGVNMFCAKVRLRYILKLKF